MSDIKQYENNKSIVHSFTPQDVLKQICQIQDLMSKAMKKGEHYGVIPGCGDKPVLLKAGAEKINFMFRLAPRFEIIKTDYPDGHREIQIISSLIHIPTDQFWGQGVGSCTTLEGKFRYRNDMVKDENGKPKVVPKEYWKTRDPELIGGSEFSTTKKGDTWFICRKIEHDNPADYYNTILKMAKKRSLVDADLTATAASDIFNQDIEELAEAGLIDKEEKQEEKRKAKEMETRFEEVTEEFKIKDTTPPKSKKSEKKLDPEATPSAKDLNDFENEALMKMNPGEFSEWLMNLSKGLKFVSGIRSNKQLWFLKSKFRDQYKESK